VGALEDGNHDKFWVAELILITGREKVNSNQVKKIPEASQSNKLLNQSHGKDAQGFQ